MKIHLVSLGCARNLVDSEIMTGRLISAGYAMTDQPEEAAVIIVNTCSFIESAIDESIDAILELASFKEKGACQQLIVAGCLPERFRESLLPSLPEVDVFLGTGAFDTIVDMVKKTGLSTSCNLPDPNLSPLQNKNSPRAVSSNQMAYLKVSDGCNKHCTYCIIPKLRGRQKSRPVSDIIAEARTLIRAGVKELNLVAQDTTCYGKDLDSSESATANLLQELAALSGNTWIRMLYGHPESIDQETIITVANHSNICSYFDIPVQHASDRILRKMGRNCTREDLYALFKRIRSAVPDVALRTSIMVGFPGETEADVAALLDFIARIRFDHLGVFVYSDAEDLPSHHLPDHVPPEVARDRYDRLMSAQQEISRNNLKKYINQQMTVLVEEIVEPNLYMGRTAFQAPEVDGITYIHSKKEIMNTFAEVKITDTLEYDLVGESL